MLHILFLILKIAGIILAAILGILILLVCTALFVPFQYKARAQWDGGSGNVKIRGRITWLFRLIEIRFLYRDGRSAIRLRIAWHRLGAEKGHKEEEKYELEHEDTGRGTDASETPETADPQNQEPGQQDEKEVSEWLPEKEEDREEHLDACSETHAEDDEEKAAGDPQKHNKIYQALQKIRRRVQGYVRKIKSSCKKIWRKARNLMEKKARIQAFLSDDTHKKAFSAVKVQGLRLLKKTGPRQFYLKVCFGFADPCHTGQALAGLAMIVPFLPGDIRVFPDFEKRIFKGGGRLKGRVYLASFAAAAFQLIRRKAVRQTYRDLREFIEAEF